MYIQRLRKFLIEVNKIVLSQGPSYLLHMLKLNNPAYLMRNAHVLNLPTYDSQRCGKNTTRHQDAKLWNALCNEYKNTSSKESFE